MQTVQNIALEGLHVAAVHSPLTSIAENEAAANWINSAQNGPVLLAGRSYGGAVITEAGRNPKVADWVYFAAFAPDKGEALGRMAKKFPPTDNFAQDLSGAEKSTMIATQSATPGALTPDQVAAFLIDTASSFKAATAVASK